MVLYVSNNSRVIDIKDDMGVDTHVASDDSDMGPLEINLLKGLV
jgi:hypothetical protein